MNQSRKTNINQITNGYQPAESLSLKSTDSLLQSAVAEQPGSAKQSLCKSRLRTACSSKFRIPVLTLVLLLSLSLIFIAGCKKTEESETEPSGTVETSQETPATPTPTPTMTPTPIPTPTPAQPALNEMNLLTGAYRENPEEPQPRPLAIMVNNTVKALPQMGIRKADLIFEMPVEYGITRLMAVFSRVEDIPELGSIRSARHDFVELNASLDGLLLHVGGSHFALDLIRDEQIGSLDFMRYGSGYWRDPDWQRSRGQEHSVKTEADRLMRVLENNEQIRRELEDPQPFIAFHHPDEFVAVSGEAAVYLRVPFSRDTIAEFYYDEDEKLYNKHQFGRPHLDMSEDLPLQFTNLLLLQTEIPTISQSGHVDADLSSGAGYYASGGYVMPMTWEKGALYDRLRFYDAAGNPLTINSGKTYIGISPVSRDIIISDEAP